MNGQVGATKDQIYNAIWWESDSSNVKNLIAVNQRHLKNDLECAGIGESLIYRDNRCLILLGEIECNSDQEELKVLT